jgi:hypothetical protein
VTVAAAILTLTAAGCAGQPAARLPGKARPAAAVRSAKPDRTLSAGEQVTQAYQGYWRAYAEAMGVRSLSRARAIMAPYDLPAALPQAVKYLRLVWAAHDVAAGGAVTHVLSVQVHGHRAVLHDCLDLSQFGLRSTVTGQVVPGSFGGSRLDFYITLMLSAGRWRVSNMVQVEVPCAP